MKKGFRIALLVIGVLVLAGGSAFVALRLEPWLSADAAFKKAQANAKAGKYHRAFHYIKIASDKKPGNVNYAWTATQMSAAVRNANAAYFYAQRAWKDGRKERDVLRALVQFTFFPDKKQKLDYAMSLVNQMGDNIDKDDVRADLYEGFGDLEKARDLRQQQFARAPLPKTAAKLALLHLKTGNDSVALSFLESCREQQKLNDEGFALLARIYAKKGDLKKAEQCFQEANESNKSSENLEYDHAVFMLATKNFDRATSMLDSLVAKYPENKNFETTRISVLIAKRDFNGVLRECDKSTAPIGLIAPLRGRALVALNRLAEAEAAYDTALSHTRDLRILLEYGNFLLKKMQKIEKAAGIFQTVLKVNPTEPVANFGLASIALKAKDYQEAKKRVESILSGKKPTPLAYLLLAQINFMEGQPQAALENCDKTLTALPGFEKALLLKALSYDRLGQLDKADEILTKLARSPSKDHEQLARTKRVLIAIKVKRKLYSDALKLVAELDPSGKAIDMNRIRFEIYALSCDFSRAEETLSSIKSAIKKNDFLVYQSWLSELRGDTLRAAAILETDLLSKKNALRWAMLHIKMGKTDDIINRLPKDSMTVNDWLRLASLTDIRKLYAVSAQIYKNALKLDEGNEIVLNNYAYAAMQSPGFNHKEVLKAVKKAYVALSERPEVLQTYAEALNKCGKPAECIKLLKEKTTQVKQSANLLYQLGSAYEKTGDIRGAISSYKMALAFPESTPDWPSEVNRRDLMTRTEEMKNKIDKK